MTRVVLVIIDALPNRHVSPRYTPHVWAQVESGGRAPLGGVGELTAATYPNHAALITGVGTLQSGVLTNSALVDGTFVPAEDFGPGAPTLFDAVAGAGLTSTCIVGDQKLIGVMAGDRATSHWPPHGVIPDGVGTCNFGYPLDREVLTAVDALGLDVDLAVVHLNETDTAEHIFGPDSDEAFDQYLATDDAYGQLIERLRPRWAETVLITVSDHSQETLTDEDPIDLRGALADVLPHVVVRHEGTGAILLGQVDDATVRAVPGVEGCIELGPDVWCAWPAPGRWFNRGRYPLRGGHGSPRTLDQVAVVSGGAPQAAPLARRIEHTAPRVTEWSGHIGSVLGCGHP